MQTAFQVHLLQNSVKEDSFQLSHIHSCFIVHFKVSLLGLLKPAFELWWWLGPGSSH